MPSDEHLPACIKEFAEFLKTEYLQDPIIQEDPWPPPPCKKYCDLAWSNYESSWFGNNSSIEEIFQQPLDFTDEESDSESESEDKISKTKPFRILIDGDPGVGKTTLCRKLAKSWAEGVLFQNFNLVLLVQLRDQRNARASSYQCFFYHDNSKIQKQVVRYVGNTSGANTLFIFDGFDELSKEERSRGSIFLDIVKRRKLRNSSVVVTSRPYGSDTLQSLQTLTRHIQIKGFQEEQIRECIRESIPVKAKAEKLIKKLNKDRNLQQLFVIPNNCAIIIYIYKCEGKLPNTLTELYTKFIDNTLVRNADDIALEKRREYENALKKLAYLGLRNEQLTFQRDEIIPEKGSTLGLMTASKSYTSSGRVVAYNFLHLTIQEYYAACWINASFSESEKIKFLNENYSESRFRVTLIFLAGITKFSGVELRNSLSRIWESVLVLAYNETIDTKVNRLHANRLDSFRTGIFKYEQLRWFLTLAHETQSAVFDSNTMSCHVILVLDFHYIDDYLTDLLGSFLSTNSVIFERLEILLDHQLSYETFFGKLQLSKSNVQQLGLHNCSLHHCDEILGSYMFKEVEYLRMDSPLHYKTYYQLRSEKVKLWGADLKPTTEGSRALRALLLEGHLRHLLLHYILPPEAESILKCTLTPALPKSKLTTLCLHCELGISQEVFLHLNQAIRSNKSIKILNLCIGSDILGFWPYGRYSISKALPSPVTSFEIYSKEIVRIRTYFLSVHCILSDNKAIEHFSLTRTQDPGEEYIHFPCEEKELSLDFTKIFFSLSTITRLTISCVLLCIPYLNEMLENNKTLISLTLTEVDSMCNSKSSSQGIFYYLAQGLRKNNTLKRLCLNSATYHLHCDKSKLRKPEIWPKFRLDNDDLINSNIKLFQLLDCIQKHSSLKVFVFDFYSHFQKYEFGSFNRQNQRALTRVMLRNKSLQTLTISGFSFENQQMIEVARALVLNGRRSDIELTFTKRYFEDHDTHYKAIQAEVVEFKNVILKTMMTVLTYIMNQKY